MKINKQLFEDVLSGKLKGTFVLRNNDNIKSTLLERSSSISYPYTFILRCYLYTSTGFADRLNPQSCNYDIIDFIPDTNMKENELTIEIPEGKIVDWEESKKQNKIVLKNEQLTYEDVCMKLFKKIAYYTTLNGEIESGTTNYITDPNNATTEHQLECILAKNKLANVAIYLNNGWKPRKGDHVFTITCCCDFKNKPIVLEHYFGTGENLVLFQTQKKAKQAIEILGEETIKLALEPLGI